MNKKDILVGRTYRNLMYPNTIYLGVAIRKHDDNNPSPPVLRKELVIIGGSKNIGINVTCAKTESSKHFWNQFHLTETN